ncbi:phage terminase small subunit [Rhodococcus zopfii]|uniref:phage terminase small subunit n=1 Tax=Rhodococcus zopfii TaxID=43772 RepID=UPI003527643E
MPGPPPKRSTQRRRRNQPEGGAPEVVSICGKAVKPPAEDRTWHTLAKAWYRSLKDSGQAKFYEPSDWQAARFCAYVMTRHLRDHEDNGAPLRAGMIETIWSMMGDLFTTEAARRRARVELVRASGATPEPGQGTVSIIDDYRDDLGLGG